MIDDPRIRLRVRVTADPEIVLHSVLRRMAVTGQSSDELNALVDEGGEAIDRLARERGASPAITLSLQDRIEALSAQGCRLGVPCKRGSLYQCDPCRRVFRLADEAGAFERLVAFLDESYPNAARTLRSAFNDTELTMVVKP